MLAEQAGLQQSKGVLSNQPTLTGFPSTVGLSVLQGQWSPTVESEESRHRGEAQVGELSISKVIDKSSVYILQTLLKGDALDNIQIDMTSVESDKTVFVYYTIKGATVRITNYSTSGAGDEGAVASESFSLNCTSLTWTYQFKDPTTKQATPSTVGFNLDTVVTAPTGCRGQCAHPSIAPVFKPPRRCSETDALRRSLLSSMVRRLSVSDLHDEFKVTTPIDGSGPFSLVKFSGTEGLSRLFRFQLELISSNTAVAATDLVGLGVTLGISSGLDASYRPFHGIVSRLVVGGLLDGARSYVLQLVPWFWMLTRTADCRIFQNQTSVQIVQAIFGEMGFSDYQLNLSGSYTTREYCVQYRETDFQFISRLLEDEGISYYFSHEDGKHTMVLIDDAGGYVDCAENQVVHIPDRRP